MSKDKRSRPRPSPVQKPSSPPEDETRTYISMDHRLQPGSLLDDRYEIIGFLGMGGMGRVYRARDLELGIEVALKVIRPELVRDEETSERLKRELILARKVSHRNVVRIHDLGEVDGIKYLSMSYIPGRSLKDAQREKAPLRVERALSIMTQVCEAAAAAHSEGVIHRDLKPANILVDEDDRVYITDFGIARSLESSDLTRTGAVIGTPAYLSPEQRRGKAVDERSDVYSLGLIFYELLTGEQAPADPRQIRSKLSASAPSIPRYLAPLVSRCLAEDPERRYADAQEILKDLQNQQVSRARTPFLRHIGMPTAGVLAILALAALLLFWIIPITSPWDPLGRAGAVDQTPAYSVAVLPFANNSSDSELGWLQTAMVDLLTSELGQGREDVRVVSSERVLQTLSDLKMPAERLGRDAVKRVAGLLDADLIIQGSLTLNGPELRVDMQVADRLSPGQPTYFKATGNLRKGLFGIVEALASNIEEEYGLPDEPGSHAPTTSIPALMAFEKGSAAFRRGEYEAADEAFRDAHSQDPGFLRAYLKRSESLEWMGRSEEAVEILEEALAAPDAGDRPTARRIRARLALRRGEFDEALEAYRALVEALPNDASLLFEAATAHQQAGNLEQAVKALEKVVELDPGHPRAYFELGKNTFLLGEAEKALGQHLVKALTISTQLNDEYAKADVINAMGVVYERMGNYEEALRNYDEAFALREQVGNRAGAATTLLNIANIRTFRGDFAAAKEILGRAEQMFEEIGDKRGLAKASNLLGVLHEDQGRLSEALAYYKRGLQLRKQVGDDRLTAQSYDNIGFAYSLKGEHDNAEVYYQQALDLKRSIGDEAGIILSLQNMGFLRKAQGRLAEALQHFLEALQRSRPIKFENAIAVSLGNLGEIHRWQGRFKAALESYREALEILRRLEDKKGVAEYLKHTGNALLDLGAWEEADIELNQALELGEELNNLVIIADVNVSLCRLGRLRGDWDAAAARIAEALRLATQSGHQKTLVQAHLERALLLASQGDLPGARQDLEAARGEVSALGDTWLGLQVGETAARLRQIEGDHAATARACEQTLPKAEEMGLKPCQYKLHSMAGTAYLSTRETAKARRHLTAARELFTQVVNACDEAYAASLRRTDDARAIFEGFQALKSPGSGD